MSSMPNAYNGFPAQQSHSTAIVARGPQYGAMQAYGSRPQGANRAQQTASWLRDYVTAIKHGRWHPFTSTERRVREATRNEPWGPTGTLLNELADASFYYANCRIIFAVLEFRLGYPPEKWRNVYKALTVLEFLLKRGSEWCVAIARDDMMFRLDDLARSFAYFAPDGRDHGINVRHRAGAIHALLRSPEQLAAERAQHAEKRRALGQPTQALNPASPLGFGGSDYASPGGFFHGLNAANGYSTPDSRQQQQPQRPLVNAGETKGVTLEENRRHLAALREMLQISHNKLCADCGEGRSSWASVSCGVFVCLVCAGVHRGLGTHVSKVRSCSLDNWLPEQVAFMAGTGNGKAAGFWEARLPPGRRPKQADSLGLEAFIRSKYEARTWASGEWPPAEAFPNLDQDGPAPAAQAAADAAAAEAQAEADAAAAEAAAAAEGERFREVQRRLAAEAERQRRVPPPNFMDIDAELDAAPLAWAGATVVTHGDAGVSTAADAEAALDDPFAEAPLPPQQPAAAAAAISNPQPQAQTVESATTAAASAAPAATAQSQPTARSAPRNQQSAQRQQQQQQQNQRRQQGVASPSLMNSAGPRRPMNLEPLRDPFAPSLAAQRPQQPQPPPPQARHQPPQPAAAQQPHVPSSAHQQTWAHFGSGDGSSSGRQAGQPDAASIARARAALSAQYADGSTPRGGAGGGSKTVWPPPGSPMSAAQQALDRLAQARARAAGAAHIAEPGSHPGALPPQQPGQPPAQGPEPHPAVYKSKFVQPQQPGAGAAPTASRPRRPYQPPGVALSSSERSSSGGFSAAGAAGGMFPAPCPQAPQQLPPQQGPAALPHIRTSVPAAAATAPAAAFTPLQHAGSDAAPPQQRSVANPRPAAAYGSFTAPPGALASLPPTPAQPQRRPQQPFGFQHPAAAPREPTGFDAIGSGGLGFRAPLAPRESPIEAMRRQMRQQAAAAAAPLPPFTRPIKAVKAGSGGTAMVVVHSDATGRPPMAPPAAQQV